MNRRDAETTVGLEHKVRCAGSAAIASGAPAFPPAWLATPRFAVALVVVCALLAYANSLHGPFVLDDIFDIVLNKQLRQGWPVWSPFVTVTDDRLFIHSRPIAVLSFAANYALGGLDVVYYHGTNIALHILAGLTLLGIARRTFLLPSMRSFHAVAAPLALLIALVWTLHPLQTGSVTYIVQRYESLMGLFYLLTLYSAIRGAQTPRHARRWSIASAITCLLAMGCKEVAVSAPLLVLLYDRAFMAGTFRDAWRARRGLYLGLAACWLVFLPLYAISSGGFGLLPSETSAFAGYSPNSNWRQYALNQPSVILHYLRLSVWPSGQCLDYDWRPTWDFYQIGPSIGLIAGLLALTLWLTAHRPKWGFLGAWFFLILAPSSSVVPIRDLAFEHRMYLPLAAVVSVLVVGAYLVLQGQLATSLVVRRSVVVLAAALVVALGGLTIRRNQTYASTIRLWEDNVSKRPQNARARFALAIALADSGQAAAALEHIERLAAALPDPSDFRLQNAWGACLTQLRQREQAIPHYLTALRSNERAVDTRLNLATALAACGYLEAAVAFFRDAVELDPNLRSARFPTTVATRSTREEQVRFLAKACRVDEPIQLLTRPIDRCRVAYEMGYCLMRADRPKLALEFFAQADALHPDVELAHALQEARSACSQRIEAADGSRRAAQ